MLYPLRHIVHVIIIFDPRTPIKTKQTLKMCKGPINKGEGRGVFRGGAVWVVIRVRGVKRRRARGNYLNH